MKNRSKFIGIIALVALIGFLGVSCDDGGTTTTVVQGEAWHAPAISPPGLDIAATDERAGFFNLDDHATLPGMRPANSRSISHATDAQRHFIYQTLYAAASGAVTAFNNNVLVTTVNAPNPFATDAAVTALAGEGVLLNWATLAVAEAPAEDLATQFHGAGIGSDQHSALTTANIILANVGTGADLVAHGRLGAVRMSVSGNPRSYADVAGSGRYLLTTPEVLQFRFRNNTSDQATIYGRAARTVSRDINFTPERQDGFTHSAQTVVMSFVLPGALGATGENVFYGKARISWGDSTRFQQTRSWTTHLPLTQTAAADPDENVDPTGVEDPVWVRNAERTGYKRVAFYTAAGAVVARWTPPAPAQ